MAKRWTSRIAGFALAFFVLALTSGCQQPDPAAAKQSFETAQSLEKKGDLAGAMAAYMKAAQQFPKGEMSVQAHLKWGELALKNQQPDSAVQAYTPLMHLEKPTTVTFEGRAVQLPQDAEALHDRAMEAADKIKSSHITYKLMDALVRLTGRNPAYSYWLAIFLFTAVIKLVLTPLTINQLRSSRKMMLLQPRLKEIQDRYRDRPEELNRRMMALYKDEGVNPLGCGSGMILQMVILIGLYRVILDYQYQFTMGHFLWVGSALSHSAMVVNLPPFITGIKFLGTSLAKPDIPLLIIYAISMFVQSRLTMVPTMDPQQAQQQKMMAALMPLFLLTVLSKFPSAFVLYWLLFNLLSTVQQLHINKQLDEEMGKKPLQATDGGADSGSSDGRDDGKSNGRAGENGSSPKKLGGDSGSKKGPGRSNKKSNRRG